MRSAAQSGTGRLRALLPGLPICAVGRQERGRCRGRRRAGVRGAGVTAIVLVGAGRMGSALLKGWLARGIKPIIVIEPKPSAETKKLARKKAITLVEAPSAV